MLFGGLALPAGEFGKTDGSDDAGYAKTGYFGGAEIMFSLAPSVGIVLDGRYIINKINEEEVLKQIGVPSGSSVSFGSWTGILPMGGIRLYTTEPIGLFVDAQAGYMFATGPSIEATLAGHSVKREMKNGRGLAYAASAGLDIGNTLVLGGSYIISKPKFDAIESMDGTSSPSTTVEGPMNMIQVWAGIRF